MKTYLTGRLGSIADGRFELNSNGPDDHTPLFELIHAMEVAGYSATVKIEWNEEYSVHDINWEVEVD